MVVEVDELCHFKWYFGLDHMQTRLSIIPLDATFFERKKDA